MVQILYKKGDELKGNKIILQAGEIHTVDQIRLTDGGHRGFQAVGRKTARAYIDQETMPITKGY